MDTTKLEEFKDGYDGEALRQKHAAYKIIPTTIEKTMTPLQLFKADNLRCLIAVNRWPL